MSCGLFGIIQAQLDLYHASENPENGEAAQETIQNGDRAERASQQVGQNTSGYE